VSRDFSLLRNSSRAVLHALCGIVSRSALYHLCLTRARSRMSLQKRTSVGFLGSQAPGMCAHDRSRRIKYTQWRLALSPSGNKERAIARAAGRAGAVASVAQCCLGTETLYKSVVMPVVSVRALEFILNCHEQTGQACRCQRPNTRPQPRSAGYSRKLEVGLGQGSLERHDVDRAEASF